MSEILLSRLLACLFWAIALLLIYMSLEIRDWWLYAPLPQKIKCAIFGHDYHNGAATNIKAANYTYDFCQRCHTEQNKREVTS